MRRWRGVLLLTAASAPLFGAAPHSASAVTAGYTDDDLAVAAVVPTVSIVRATPVSVPTISIPVPTPTPTATPLPTPKPKPKPHHRVKHSAPKPTATPRPVVHQTWILAYLTSYCPGS